MGFRKGLPEDPAFVEERLYEDDDGRFFLVGRGGPETSYAVRLAPRTADSPSVGSRRLEACTPAQAEHWTEETEALARKAVAKGEAHVAVWRREGTQ